jgi:hypothetical protein
MIIVLLIKALASNKGNKDLVTNNKRWMALLLFTGVSKIAFLSKIVLFPFKKGKATCSCNARRHEGVTMAYGGDMLRGYIM